MGVVNHHGRTVVPAVSYTALLRTLTQRRERDGAMVGRWWGDGGASKNRTYDLVIISDAL